jgi:hypothetical protein
MLTAPAAASQLVFASVGTEQRVQVITAATATNTANAIAFRVQHHYLLG